MSKKSDNGNNTSAAEDILRQFHPELYHKRKLDAGKGQVEESAPVETRSTPAPSSAPKKVEKVAPIHARPKARKAPSMSLSPSDWLYRFFNFFRDLIDWIATAAANSFLRYIINIYVVIALIVIVPTAYAGYKWWNKPPHFLADECYECFTTVHDDYFRMRSANASAAEWDGFVAESRDEVEDMVYNLENTSSVRQRERQLLMWIGKSYLLKMLEKRDGDINAEEQQYQTLLRDLHRVRRDRDNMDQRARYN
ncbi:MAG: hypothetical protein CMJ46_15435 [Planctomyces sp.]|nr:hypothetical protein [Planctomyces sp.]